MKKALVILLTLCMLLSLVACAQPAAAPAPAPAATEAPAAEPEAPAETEAPATEPEAPAGDVVLAFNCKNKAKAADGETSLELSELYLYPKGAEDKGANLLSAPQINSSEYQDYIRIVCKRPAADLYEAYVVFSNGETGTYQNLEMQAKNSLSFKAADELSCKADEDVAFTDELKTAALAGDKEACELATLAFEFKNKTGKTITAAYIYETGAEDKHSNIIETPWANCEEDADYLFPVIMRPRAATYDVAIEFEDGTGFTLTGLDMDNSIKLSLKDDTGADYSFDSALEADEEDMVEYGAIFNEDYVKPLQNAVAGF